MRRKKIYITVMVLAITLAACGNTSKDLQNDTSGSVDERKIVINDTEKIISKNIEFNDPFVNGTLTYKLNGYSIYDNLNEAGLTEGDIMEPHNTFYSQEIGEQFQKIDDYMKQDGTLNEKFKLIILDMTIKNVNAVGMTKKNEFTVSNIALRGGENVSQYNVAYFSERASVNSEQPLHYSLEQGDSNDVKIGYLILKDDMENMVGVISDSDIQFMIR
ncbi:DUF5027 family lipoprotein [Agathobacter sp.]